jgi:hypothetical protein
MAQPIIINMNSTANKFIKGIHAEQSGKRLKALADLEVYLNQPVGVGDHSLVSDEIEKILVRVKDCEDIIATIEKHFDLTTKEEVINE